MNESDEYQNKTAATPKTLNNTVIQWQNLVKLKFPCKGMNFKQQILGLNETRGLCSRKVNVGAAAKMKAPVFL